MLSMKPLVSILIPAYKAERWIAETIRSAIGETYARKEIIVVDDGSPDQTAAVARQFASKEVTVVSTDNQGAVAARNYAFSLCQGDYIQWLDADDILAPDKIERQVAAMKAGESRKILLSSSWAPFYYRTHKARFICTALCQDLTPADWLIHKMSGNLHMQTATWLTSRELCEAAGKWNSQMLSDDDGEYFCRVLLKSEGTRFVPGTGVFYRTVTTDRLSHIGNSEKKRDAMFLSMQLHVQYLRSLEDSERVRKACLTYLQNWFHNFFPDRPDIVGRLQVLAAELGGELKAPQLRWKYAWMRHFLGWKAAQSAQSTIPKLKAACIRNCDRAIYQLESRDAVQDIPILKRA